MNVYSENKKAHYDYEILEKFEAGLVLIGQEVKAIKTGHISLAGSYVTFQTGKPHLIGVKIPPYQPKNAPSDYNPEASRKVLLNKKEIDYLAGKVHQKGFSLIPLKIFDKSGRVKLEFGLARGKKKYNKKEKIKAKDMDRQVKRDLGM